MKKIKNFAFFVAFCCSTDHPKRYICKQSMWHHVVTVSWEDFVMFRPVRPAYILALWALLVAGQSASAQLLFDDFESYNLGALDKNLAGGPNQAPNGSGNPWFGPSPPNCEVVNAENGVMPISGTQMIRGLGSNIPDFDQNWYNLAYRLNNGQPFKQNIVLDWWFYDPLGAFGTDFRDYVALAFYDSAPSDTDGPPDYDLNNGFTKIQRISIGATTIMDGGFDPNFYQARIVGATDGYNSNGSWFNTQTTRTVGWHHAVIMVGPSMNDGTNDVLFFIDDMTNPTLEHTIPADFNYGFNVIEVNANFGPVTGYFDDIRFDSVGN
jgi:hypothetical protein